MTYMHHFVENNIAPHETMNAAAHMDLTIASITTIPKQDDRRTILDFVHSQQSFAKAHVKEGKTYMASWKDESETIGPTSEKEHPIQGCGFATPVLKSRTRPRAGLSSRNERHTKGGKGLDSKSECSNNTRKENQAKPRGRTTQREEQRKNSPKRGPDQQTDQEQRLQERREKKKARRDVMRPESLKKKQADLDPQSKTKKKKQKLPSGLALMYGFTASNVGQKRLTVGPLTRPGVFGKGKASVQAVVRRSKQKSSRNNAVFSESDFLKSAGKDHRKKGDTPCSSESDTTSFDCTDGQEKLEQEPRARRITRDKHTPEAAAQSGPVTRQTTGAVVTNTSKAVEKNISTNSSPLKPSSVVWDIEKVNGVLPAESSSLVSQGPKPSTLLLDVAQKRWSFECSHTNGDQDKGPSIGQTDLATKPPSVSSIRPSESPFQENHPAAGAGQDFPEGVSKYFSLGPSPQVEVERHTNSSKDMDCVIQIPEETARMPTVSQGAKSSGSLDDGPERPTVSDPYKLDSDPELIFGDEVAYYPQRDLDDSDWLLSDPFLGRYPTSPLIEDDWAVLEDMLVTQLEGEYEDDPTAFEQMGYLYEESGRDGGHSLWLGEDPQPDHFSDELLGGDDIPNLELTSDGDIRLDQNDLTNLESDGSESDSDLREHIKISQKDIRDTESDHLICFDEGRYLLHGYRISEAVNNLELAEADTAQSLVGHWIPQRY